MLSLLCWIKHGIICDRPNCNNYHFVLVARCDFKRNVVTNTSQEIFFKRSASVGHIFQKKKTSQLDTDLHPAMQIHVGHL